MKINTKALAPLVIVAAFGLGALSPHAQTAPAKIGFVNLESLFAAHPSDKDIKALNAKAKAELADLEKKIKDIDAKGANATAADKDARKLLVDTYSAKAKDYDTQLKAKVSPVEQSVDKAISTYAKGNGFSVVMDSTAAQGLVVYADDASDLTEAIKKTIK